MAYYSSTVTLHRITFSCYIFLLLFTYEISDCERRDEIVGDALKVALPDDGGDDEDVADDRRKDDDAQRDRRAEQVCPVDLRPAVAAVVARSVR